MIIRIDPSSSDSYRTFLAVKRLPHYRFWGRNAEFPDEYASQLGLAPSIPSTADYQPSAFLFDYQRDISRLAIRKRKFAVFMQCGLGKCLISLEYARHVAGLLPPCRCVLLVAPLNVVRQTVAECSRFLGSSLVLEQVRANRLQSWLQTGTSTVGITNYEALTDDLQPGRLGCLILDESQMMKSMYGRHGQQLIRLGAGLDWKLCLSGTPAPNDRIEYGNHAVFLDQVPTLNAFLARYFVNRGQTDNRWELKAHALRPFYRDLSHWCIFVENPATYGWLDNPTDSIPPLHVHIEDVPLTEEQKKLLHKAGGDMFGTPGGITSRAKLSQLAKGRHDGQQVASNKPAYIKALIDSWSGEESTLVWCRFNHEQDTLAALLPRSASLTGSTPETERERIIEDFQAGRIRTLVSKPRILGLGLNLQIATRQVFNGLNDSFEEFHQAIKRSNRIGSTRPLHVHVPVTEVERAMVDTVLTKAHRVEADILEQEKLFKEVGYVAL